MSKKQEQRCVAKWLADPADCWLKSGCRYWDRRRKRCAYLERREAEDTQRKVAGKVGGGRAR